MVLCAFFFRRNASVYAETRLLVPHANAVRPYQLSLRLKHRIQKRFGLCGTCFFVSCANAVRLKKLAFYPEMWYASYMLWKSKYFTEEKKWILAAEVRIKYPIFVSSPFFALRFSALDKASTYRHSNFIAASTLRRQNGNQKAFGIFNGAFGQKKSVRDQIPVISGKSERS